MTEEEALNKLTAYCAAAEHCESELCEKMRKWGIDYTTIDKMVDYLRKEQYIDDERYSRAFINDKYRFAKWGKVKIAQALTQKRISRSVFGHLLNEIDMDEYTSILSDILRTKRKSVHADSEYELNGKLVRFAMSRGFEMDDIRRCMPGIDMEPEMDADMA